MCMIQVKTKNTVTKKIGLLAFLKPYHPKPAFKLDRMIR
jgi:hypothetical protein